MIRRLATTLATLAVLLATFLPAQAASPVLSTNAAAPDSTCNYTAIVLSSPPCSGGLIQYTCNANNCFISGECSVSGTPVGPLTCVAYPPGTQLTRGMTYLGAASCTAHAVVALGVSLSCSWWSDT